MIIINQQDIQKAIHPKEMIGAIERAYLIQDKKTTIIPNRMHIDKGDDTLLLMPGFIDAIFGTKLVSVFPENLNLKKPVVNGIMVLNNVKTGEPLALINGNKLTALRTAAISATAVKHLAPEVVKTLGIIGAGVQAFHQAVIVCTQRPFTKLIIADMDINKAETLKQELKLKLESIQIECTENTNQLVIESDVIITATSSYQPVFDVGIQKLRNKTFVCIGSYKPNMQEIPSKVMQAAGQIFVDTLHAKKESGDLKIPLDHGLINESTIFGFDELLSAKTQLTDAPFQLFKSVGMALFDLTFAETLYNKALEKGIGTKIQL